MKKKKEKKTKKQKEDEEDECVSRRSRAARWPRSARWRCSSSACWRTSGGSKSCTPTSSRPEPRRASHDGETNWLPPPPFRRRTHAAQENILLARPRVDRDGAVESAGDGGHAIRLVDFGNAIRGSRECLQYYDDFEIQTLGYRAPEVLVGVPFGAPIDCWSLGVVLLELFVGSNPFLAHTRVTALTRVKLVLGPLPRARFVF